MSRIGNLPVLILDGVTVVKTGTHLVVSGPKGDLSLDVDSAIGVEVNEAQVSLTRKSDEKRIKALHGLTRSLVFNMITGVTSGWSKQLELLGVGFRAQVQGEKLVLSIGRSHPVEFVAPEGIAFEVADNTKITILGKDKQLVGEVAAQIRRLRPPEPYKGKGIRLMGEMIKRKAGKAAKVGAGATK